jgi:hypothetical protein
MFVPVNLVSVAGAEFNIAGYFAHGYSSFFVFYLVLYNTRCVYITGFLSHSSLAAYSLVRSCGSCNVIKKK